MTTTRRIALWMAIALAGAASAAPPPATKIEIDHLLSYLEHSGCQFARSGTWHDSRAARAHLDMKYKFLLKRDMVNTTDDFIERAATGSSMVGDTYLVRCGDGVAMPSAKWLRVELVRFRQQRPAAKD